MKGDLLLAASIASAAGQWHAGARFAHSDSGGGQWRAQLAVDAGRQSARYFDEVGNEGAGLAEPRAPALRAVVGLVWRTLLLWLVLLLLMTLASLFA